MKEGNNLVTGGTGFVGRHLVDTLRSYGQRTTILTRQTIDDPDVLCGNLTAADFTLNGNEFSTVFHLAGLAHTVPRNEKEAAMFFCVNSQGTGNLLRALEHSAKLPEAFVYVSSVNVYGCEAGEMIDEETPRTACDPYGASKREGEDKVLEWCARLGVRGGVVRIPVVVGKGVHGNLKAMVEALRRRRYFGVGSGSARRSMVLASDVARILPAIARLGGTYNLTDGYNPSFLELEDAICEVLSRRPPLRLPEGIASAGGRVGGLLNEALGISLPLTVGTVTKMTATLTFSDQRARHKLGWRPERVLDHVAQLVA
jgi:nucleoside-diphosphate-sugar epimerase